MRKILIGIAALGLAATGAMANDNGSKTPADSTAATTPSTTDSSKSLASPSADTAKSADTVKSTDTSATSADSSKSMDSSKSGAMASNSEVSGQLSKIDKDSRSLTISLPSGDTQQLKLSSDAKVTRDGADIGLDQLKSGDQVRASFDPKTNQATSITVTPKTDTSKSMK